MIYNTVEKPQPTKSTAEITIHISLEFFFIDFDIFDIFDYTDSYKIRQNRSPGGFFGLCKFFKNFLEFWCFADIVIL